tara:strand:+ start:78 stop:683 length:606 start_codon:yes stop_codon:yes gene_type:complete
MENIFENNNITATLFYIAVALISIAMYHKSNSNYNSKTKKIHSIASFMYIYKYIQFSTFFVCIASIWSNHEYLFKIYYDNNFFLYLGIAVSGLAITLFAISRFSLGRNYSPCYDSYMPKNLKTTGIYSLVRHPIYSSNILLMIGIFISTGSLIIAANTTVLLVYYILSAFIEEKAIIRKFPKYKSYKSRTGMFLPNFSRMI